MVWDYWLRGSTCTEVCVIYRQIRLKLTLLLTKLWYYYLLLKFSSCLCVKQSNRTDWKQHRSSATALDSWKLAQQPQLKAEMVENNVVTTASTLPRSTSFVAMTMIWQFSCQTIRQKSTTVCCRQPCVAMYDLDGDGEADRPWSIYSNEDKADSWALNWHQKCRCNTDRMWPRHGGSISSNVHLLISWSAWYQVVHYKIARLWILAIQLWFCRDGKIRPEWMTGGIMR